MIGRILKKTLGITLIEALISLSLISTVAITGTNFYIDIKKNDLLNIETKRIESVIKGLDKRFELEGYSSLLWQQDMSGNTNEEVGNVSAVMDGKIDNFIRAYLLGNLESKQNV